MQLDRTEIVIRQRSALELLDLSLLVLRRHWKPLLLANALLGIPLILLDLLMVSWIQSERSYLVAEHLDSPESAMRLRHNYHTILLFVAQFQIISLPAAIYIGNRIFFQEVTFLGLLRKLRPIFFRCLWVLGIARLALVITALEVLVDREVTFDFLVEFLLLGGLTAISLIARGNRPFAPEILGLELCKLATKSKHEISYAQRSRGLHRALAADNLARFFAAICFGILLMMMLLGTALFCKGVSTGDWVWNQSFDLFVLPLALWMVGVFYSVFRFLAYLDSRIRLEGWEVELRLRAEAERLEKPHAATAVVALNDADLPEVLTESK